MRKFYKGVIWFDAEKRDRLLNEYISLGPDLNIIRDDETIGIEKLARRVKNWLENPSRAGWLLVYDNVPNYETIGEFIHIKEGKLLVTSRYASGWPQKNIPIDIFTIEAVKILYRESIRQLTLG
jgi:hypothetical protein